MSTLSISTASSFRLSARLRAILAVVLIADVLDLMDSTITNIAAPSIVRDIGGGESLIKWLGASYALAMGVLLVVGGRLGDRYGKRRMFLTGIAGFTVASLACGLSVDPAMLITGRLGRTRPHRGGFYHHRRSRRAVLAADIPDQHRPGHHRIPRRDHLAPARRAEQRGSHRRARRGPARSRHVRA